MADYICVKSGFYSGKLYTAGEVVPEDAVLASSVGSLIERGMLAVRIEEAPTEETKSSEEITIFVRAGESNVELHMVPNDIQQIFDVLQNNVTGAEKIIQAMTCHDALLMISICDARKGIIKAAEERSIAISVEAETKVAKETAERAVEITKAEESGET